MTGDATHAVILNGVLPAGEGGGAKRREGSLTETRAKVVGVSAGRFTYRLRPLRSAVLHCVPDHLRPPGTPFRMTGFGEDAAQ